MRLKEYEEDAVFRAKNKINSRIKNSSLEHANILIKTMINHATETDDLYIYSGSLPQETFAMLDTTKAKSINLLVDPGANLNWIKELFETKKQNISAFVIDKARPNHFLCTTGGFFRFETEPKNFEAEANFNEPSTVNVLIEAFNRYSEKSQKVTLE